MKKQNGFTMIELLMVITALGVLVFMAFPNAVNVRTVAEDSLAINRAQSLNAAKIAYKIRGVGSWQALASDAERYAALAPFLSYAPDTFTANDGTGFVPDGYSFVFGGIDSKVVISNNVAGQVVGY